MSSNLIGRINNLSATTSSILIELSQLQALIGSCRTRPDALSLYQLISNMASSYSSNPPSVVRYSAGYINTLIRNYQLSSSAKTSAIDLSNYYNTTDSGNTYHLKFVVSLPLSLNSIDTSTGDLINTVNALSIDLTSFYTSSESSNK